MPHVSSATALHAAVLTQLTTHRRAAIERQACARGEVVHAWPAPEFGTLLYDHWVWDVPQLFDACVLFGTRPFLGWGCECRDKIL